MWLSAPRSQGWSTFLSSESWHTAPCALHLQDVLGMVGLSLRAKGDRNVAHPCDCSALDRYSPSGADFLRSHLITLLIHPYAGSNRRSALPDYAGGILSRQPIK